MGVIGGGYISGGLTTSFHFVEVDIMAFDFWEFSDNSDFCSYILKKSQVLLESFCRPLSKGVKPR